MLFEKGKLEKLTLRVLKPGATPNDQPTVSDAPEHTYVLQVNPNSYTLSHLLEYKYNRGQGFSGSEAVYAGSPPVNMSFEFLFDGTGVVPVPSDLGEVPLVGAIASALSKKDKFVVMQEIDRFNKLVYLVDGGIHRPRQLLLVWGTLVFPCVLSSASYRFTLFKPDGTPLRAIASCTFCESLPEALNAAKKSLNSPDLTHLRDIREGDTLPALAHDIYGRPELYLEVARANKLVNFRRLQPASRVAFPPLAAQEKT